MTLTIGTFVLGAVCLYLTSKGCLLEVIWISLATVDTFRALRRIRPNGRRVGVSTRRRAMKEALTGWIVSATVSQVDPFLSRLFGWLPFYAPLRWIICLCFLFLRSSVSTAIYTTLLRPLLKQYETPIDLILLLFHSLADIVVFHTITLPLQSVKSLYGKVKIMLRPGPLSRFGTKIIPISSVPIPIPVSPDNREEDNHLRVSVGDMTLSTPHVPGRLLRSARKPTAIKRPVPISLAETAESSMTIQHSTEARTGILSGAEVGDDTPSRSGSDSPTHGSDRKSPSRLQGNIQKRTADHLDLSEESSLPPRSRPRPPSRPVLPDKSPSTSTSAPIESAEADSALRGQSGRRLRAHKGVQGIQQRTTRDVPTLHTNGAGKGGSIEVEAKETEGEGVNKTNGAVGPVQIPAQSENTQSSGLYPQLPPSLPNPSFLVGSYDNPANHVTRNTIPPPLDNPTGRVSEPPKPQPKIITYTRKLGPPSRILQPPLPIASGRLSRPTATLPPSRLKRFVPDPSLQVHPIGAGRVGSAEDRGQTRAGSSLASRADSGSSGASGVGASNLPASKMASGKGKGKEMEEGRGKEKSTRGMMEEKKAQREESRVVGQKRRAPETEQGRDGPDNLGVKRSKREVTGVKTAAVSQGSGLGLKKGVDEKRPAAGDVGGDGAEIRPSRRVVIGSETRRMEGASAGPSQVSLSVDVDVEAKRKTRVTRSGKP